MRDENGDITGYGDVTLEYNDNNRVVEVKEGGVTTLATYQYNALGQRVSKVAGGVTTVFFYGMNGELLAEETSGATKEYLYMGKIRMALFDADKDEIYYFLNDRLGTPLLLTDDTNTAVWEAMYLPFGEATVNPNSSVVNNLRFPGQYEDGETGFHYNYHRYYDSKTGRYLTPDPIGLEGGVNLFPYAMNNPINWIDPIGLTWLIFNRKKGILTVDPERGGADIYSIPTTSGKGKCLNDPTCEHLKEMGPIPAGNYSADIAKLTDPNFFGDILRNLTGDWGDWRVPLDPCEKNDTERSGFFLHGGRHPGSAGCIDIGGGLFGNEKTNRLLQDLLSDPDKIVPLTVR